MPEKNTGWYRTPRQSQNKRRAEVTKFTKYRDGFVAKAIGFLKDNRFYIGCFVAGAIFGSFLF